MKKVLLIIFSSFLIVAVYGGTVDSLDIPSAKMNRNFKAAVVLPASYSNSKMEYPVLYLLHGGFGHYDTWLKNTPDKALLTKLADKYNLIIVLPEGDSFSFYLDSPINRKSQFETYLTKEVIEKIDETYRTVKQKTGRVISGASMGGFGAIYLASRHPEIFCAAGSMSGAMDLSISQYKLSAEDAKMLQSQFETILGPEVKNPELYAENSPINMIHEIKYSGISMIIDTGVDDILVETNREFNRRLLYAKVPHEYVERPGEHTWEYWEKALPFQVQFFNTILENNGVNVQ